MAITFPTTLDSAATLHQAVNDCTGTLDASYTAGGTSLDLASAALFPSTGGVIYVGNERTTYTGKSGDTLTGVTALSNNYSAGASVEMTVDAAHHNDLRDAVVALEAKVGIDGSAVVSSLDKRVADLESSGGITATSTTTFQNKSISLSTNTVTGLLSEFNAACSDADFASLAGTETLTNKTLTSPTLVTPALGTPSSGVVTNLTGTASININGTVGATTPAAGTFTTLTATGNTVLGDASTDTVTVQAGSASLPSIIPTGDANTGVWFPAADTVAVSTGGAERMRIDSSGNVGIGGTVVMGSAFSFRNKIINGAMSIAQRGTSFPAITNAAYSLDRWRTNYVADAVHTVTQYAGAPSNNEFQYSLAANVTTADTSIAASQFASFVHVIEGYNVRDLIGKTFTLSFWVSSTKTGVHCVSFTNSVGNRSYVAEYTVNTANTWEYKTITVSGGLITAGTWDWTTGAGLAVRFAMATGTTYQTTAGSWQTGNFIATASQVNCLDTIGNVFAITGVQLEAGSTATPFEHRPYGVELALCQRYYYRRTITIAGRECAGYCASTTQAYWIVPFPVSMRIKPAALEQSGTAADYAIAFAATATVCSSVPTHESSSQDSATVGATVASGLTPGHGASAYGNGVSNYLGWSAEL